MGLRDLASLYDYVIESYINRITSFRLRRLLAIIIFLCTTTIASRPSRHGRTWHDWSGSRSSFFPRYLVPVVIDSSIVPITQVGFIILLCGVSLDFHVPHALVSPEVSRYHGHSRLCRRFVDVLAAFYENPSLVEW
jgi:hypothetical protein